MLNYFREGFRELIRDGEEPVTSFDAMVDFIQEQGLGEGIPDTIHAFCDDLATQEEVEFHMVPAKHVSNMEEED